MDDRTFDHLTRGLNMPGSRRRLLGLGALPVAGILATLLTDDADARRRHGRNRGNRPGKRKENRKGKRRGGPGASTPCLGPLTNLQVAVNQANPGDTLTLCAGTFAEQRLTLSKNLTLAGAGSGQTILTESTSMDSVLTVNSGATVTVQGLTLTGWGAKSPRLAAIENAGTLTLADTVVTKSRGNTAILNHGRLHLTDGSTITKNIGLFSEPGSPGITNIGGTVLIESGCQVTENESIELNFGGGIYSDVARSVELDDSSIVSANLPSNCYADDGVIGNCDG